MTPLQAHQDFYLKREDSNPTGSIKDRSLSPQIDHLIAANFHSAVISSTGNAAISAQYYCAINRLPLTVFVSPKIHPAKLKLINHPQISSRPVSAAFKFAKLHRSYNL